MAAQCVAFLRRLFVASLKVSHRGLCALESDRLSLRLRKCNLSGIQHSFRRSHGLPLEQSVSPLDDAAERPPAWKEKLALSLMREKSPPSRTHPYLEEMVQRARSWEDIKRVGSRMKLTSGGERSEYQTFLELCERQLGLLYSRGVLPATELRKNTRLHNPEELILVIWCVVRLAESGFLSSEEMSSFLYAIKCSSLLIPANLRCGRCQRIMDIFEAHLAETPSKTLLKALWSASRIPDLNVVPLMVGAEELYFDKLHQLPAVEVQWLISAADQVSRQGHCYDGQRLAVKFLTNHVRRLKDYSVEDFVDLLIALARILIVKLQYRELLRHAVYTVEDDLVRSLASLSRMQVARLCHYVLIKLDVRLECVEFPEIFFALRGEYLRPTLYCDMLYYMTKYYTVDEKLLAHFLSCCYKMQDWDTTAIRILLTSLTSKKVSDSSVAKDLVRIVEQEIRERLQCDSGLFTANESAWFFRHFVHFSLDNSPIMDSFFQTCIREIRCLSTRCLIIFIEGVGCRNTDKWRVFTLQKAMANVHLRSDSLTMKKCLHLSGAFVSMRLIEPLWLKEIASVCRRNVRVLHTRPELLNTVGNLGTLGFFDRELLQDVVDSLDACPLTISTLQSWEELINFLAACVWQGVFPKRSFEQLSSLDPKSVVYMDFFSQRTLLKLVIVLGQEKFSKGILCRDTLVALQIANRKEFRPLLGPYTQFLERITSILPNGCLRSDVFTAEGLYLNCMILTDEDGCVVEFPESFPHYPSAGDVRELVKRGHRLVGVVALRPTSYDCHGTVLLTPGQLLCRALTSCGWQVIVVNLQAFLEAADKNCMLLMLLKTAGIDVSSFRL